MDTTQEEYAKRAIDLIGLEYPADIKATYDDLPTTLPSLMKLQYHLHTLFSIGEQTNNQDLADYALFANLHVRYRILTYECDLTPADAYYFRIYETKLPLMKWRPIKENHYTESVLPFFDVIEDLDVLLPVEQNECLFTTVDDDALEGVINTPPICTCDDSQSVSQMSTDAPIDMAPRLFSSDQSFCRAYLDYRTRIGSDLVIRSVSEHKIWTTRLTLRSMDEFNIFAVSYYGIPTRIVCEDAAYLASLYSSMTGRFCGYESAGYYISATNHSRKGSASLMSLALQRLQKVWFTSPPLRRCD